MKYESPLAVLILFSSCDIMTASDGKGDNATEDDEL